MQSLFVSGFTQQLVNARPEGFIGIGARDAQRLGRAFVEGFAPFYELDELEGPYANEVALFFAMDGFFQRVGRCRYRCHQRTRVGYTPGHRRRDVRQWGRPALP